MFYALAKQSNTLSKSLHKFIAIAPCSIGQLSETDPNQGLYRLQDIGVYGLYAYPNWEHNLNEKICK